MRSDVFDKFLKTLGLKTLQDTKNITTIDELSDLLKSSVLDIDVLRIQAPSSIDSEAYIELEESLPDTYLFSNGGLTQEVNANGFHMSYSGIKRVFQEHFSKNIDARQTTYRVFGKEKNVLDICDPNHSVTIHMQYSVRN